MRAVIAHAVGPPARIPYDAAEKSMRLFAREVMPELKKVGAPERGTSAA